MVTFFNTGVPLKFQTEGLSPEQQETQVMIFQLNIFGALDENTSKLVITELLKLPLGEKTITKWIEMICLRTPALQNYAHSFVMNHLSKILQQTKPSLIFEIRGNLLKLDGFINLNKHVKH